MAKKFKDKKNKDFSHFIVPFISDLHTNSTVALCPPRVQLDAGGDYTPSKMQRWLYRDVWEPLMDEIWQVKKRLKWPLLTILGGEAADSNKYCKTELISQNESDQLSTAMKILEPVLDFSDFITVIRGTEAHSGAASWMDEQVAKDIDDTKIEVIKSDNGKKSMYEFKGYLGGVYINAAHHPGHGAHRPWTKGGDAGRLAADHMYRNMKYNYAMIKQGTPEFQMAMPDLVLRGHNHKPSDSGDTHPIRAIINPSFQLTGGFGYRLGGDILPVGAMYLLCAKGKYTVHKMHMEWPRGPYWVPA
jgi:hypothetical protein